MKTSGERTRRKLTGMGVAVVCVASSMLVIGFFLSNGELMTLGICALLLLGGCYVVAPLNLRNLELRVQLPPRFYAMHKVPVVVQLSNPRRRFPAHDIAITLHLPHQVDRSGHAAWTPAKGNSQLRESISLPARAVATELECELRSCFPLGLIEVRHATACSCPFMAYPAPITPSELQLAGLQVDHVSMIGTGAGDFFGEPRGIRPYQPGDRVTRIHPFASAHSISRGQGLQVSAFDPPGVQPDRCRIVFHSHVRSGEALRLDRFERGLSLLAGTLNYFHRSQTKLTLQADFADWRDCPCESRSQLSECLALLANARRARQTTSDDLVQVLHKASDEEQLIIVSDSPPEGWAQLVPATTLQPILINIRQARFKRRKAQLQLTSVR